MKRIKKYISLLASVILILALTGCSVVDIAKVTEQIGKSQTEATEDYEDREEPAKKDSTEEKKTENSESESGTETKAEPEELGEEAENEETEEKELSGNDSETPEEKKSVKPASLGSNTGEFGNDIPEIETSDLLEYRRCTLLESTGLIAVVEKGDNQYKLCDPEQNVLAEGCLYLDDNNGFVTFAKSEGDNTLGLLDKTGEEVIPDKYGVIDVYNEHWVCATVLTPGTDSEYDYKTFTGKYYLIDAVDVYFDGKKVKTFDRREIDRVYAYGKYLLFTDRDDGLHFCDSKMNEAEQKYDNCYVEYYEDRNGKIWHLGSGTEAFVPGCTLTPDDVDTCVYNKKGSLLDLQGNKIADTSNYSVVYTFYDGYAAVRNSADKNGIIREDGTLISECIFDEINMFPAVIKSGYVPAVLDGKFVIVSLRDGSYVESGFHKDSVKSAYAPFASKVGDDGKFIIFSGHGKIDKTFDKATVNIDGFRFVRIEENGSAGAVDMDGNYIIKPDGTYQDAFDMSISEDGTVIVGRNEDGYYIYRLTY